MCLSTKERQLVRDRPSVNTGPIWNCHRPQTKVSGRTVHIDCGFLNCGNVDLCTVNFVNDVNILFHHPLNNRLGIVCSEDCR